MSLVRRAETASKRHHLFYLWKTLRFFDDFDAHAEELMALLMAQALSARDAGLACALRGTCRVGKRMFDEWVRAGAPPPDLGDCDGNAKTWPPPLFVCKTDRIAWTFARCHLCLCRPAIHRCADLVAFHDARAYTILTCEDCMPHGQALLVKEPVKTASQRLLFPRSSALGVWYVKDLLTRCQVTARHVGTHTWEGVVRGVPRKRRVMLTSVTIDREDGSKPLTIGIPLLKLHHDKAFGRGAIRNSTVQNWKPIFSHVMLKDGGHNLVDRIVSWPLGEHTPPPPRAKRKLPAAARAARASQATRPSCTH